MKQLVRLAALAFCLMPTSLAAQSSLGGGQKIEFGAFGSYWRFDHLYFLNNSFGGGARLGVSLSDRLGIELSGDYTRTTDTAETVDVTASMLSAHLVLRFPLGDRASLLASGGYSRIVFGSAYDFTDNMVSGGLGARVFVSPNLALRFDARAQYLNENADPRGTWTGHVQGSAGASYFFGTSRRGRDVPPGEVGPQDDGGQMAEPAAPRAARPSGAAVQYGRSAVQSIEFGGFGSYWRFDHLFFLENAIGGGARIGYSWSDRIGIEVQGDYVKTTDVAATQDVSASMVTGSLIFSFPVGERASFSAAGGFTRVVFGPDPPYDFTENMISGGLGVKFHFSDHVAFRADARAFYRQGNPDPRGTWTGHVQGSAGLSYYFIPPQQGRGFSKQYQWYWGAQGGALLSKTITQPFVYDPIVGGHWLITAKRTALYVAYEQALFLGDAQTIIFDPASSGSSVGPGFRDVSFNDVRRLMFGVLAFPAQKIIEPFAGGGFALMQVLNPTVDCSGCTTQGEIIEAADRAHEAASKAFFWLMGGLQVNYSTKLNVFAHYLITSSASGFLLEGNTHTMQGGIRYSLGSSKEGITERH